MSDGSIIIDSKFEDKGALKGAEKFEGKMSSLAKKAGKVAKVLSTTLVAGLAAVGTAAFAAANDFDKAMNTIAIGTGATGDDLENLKTDFKEVFRDIPTDSETAANAISNLNTLTGATGDTLQDLTKSVLEASRMLGEDGVANSQAFGQAMQQWQIPAEEGPSKLDKLFKATQDYGIGLGEITGNLNTYGSVLQNAGFTMEQSADLFGRLNAASIQVSRVMPGLNKAFRTWADEGKNAKTELTKVINEISNAEDSTKALSIATDVFGAEGAQRLTTAIRTGAFPALEELGVSLENTEGLINGTAKETMNFGEQMNVLKNKVQTSLVPLGEIILHLADKVFPHLQSALDKVSSWMEVFNVDNATSSFNRFKEIFNNIRQAISDFFSHFEPVFNLFKESFNTLKNSLEPLWEDLKGLFESLKPILQAIGTVLGGVVVVAIGVFISALNAIVSAIGPLIRALVNLLDFFVNTFNAIIALLRGDFSSALDYWKKASDSANKFVMNIFESLKNFIFTFVETIISYFKSLYNALIGNSIIPDLVNGINEKFKEMVKFVKDLVLGFVDKIKEHFNNLKESIVTIFNKVKTFFTDIWDNIKSLFTDNAISIRDKVKEKFLDIYNSIKEKMEDIKGKIEDIWDNVKGFLESINLYNIGKDIIQGLLNGINNMTSSLFRKANEIANGIKDKIKNALRISSPSKVMIDIGKDTGKGLEEGIDKTIPDIERKSIVLSKSAIPKMEEQSKSMANNLSNKLFRNNFEGRQTVIIELDGKVIARKTLPHIDREVRIRTGRG